MTRCRPTCSTNPSSRPSREQATWTLNFGPQHPATHTTLAADPRARRRADRQGHARHRLPALRLREAGRAPELQPVRHGRRPQELHQPADERGGLAPRGREAAGHRADAALPVHPRDHRRAGADQRPPALHRRRGARPGGVHGLPVRLQPARADLRRLRRDVGLPLPPRLHPGRRRALRLQRPRASTGSGASWTSFPKVYADMEKLLFRNRIFLDRLRGVGRPEQGRRDRACRAPARSRGPAASPTTSARTSRTWSIPSSTSRSPTPTEGDCWARFIVRMEEMRQSHRIIEQAVEKLPAGPGQCADRREVPAARQADRLQQHGRADPALRADHAQPRLRDARATRSTPRSRAPTASSATTWSPTAARPPGGSGPGRRRSSTFRSFRTSSRTTCSPTSWPSWEA